MGKSDKKYPTLPFNESIILYINSFYFSTTTMTTVGYGDYSAKGGNMYEMFARAMF